MSIPTGYLLAGIERAIIPYMDKYEIRRLRVLSLIKKDFEGVQSKFADKIERAPSYVGRMLYEKGKKGKKNISDTLITVIEEKCGLTPGWLDAIPKDAQLVAVEKLWQTLSIDDKKLAIKMIETMAEPKESSINPTVKAVDTTKAQPVELAPTRLSDERRQRENSVNKERRRIPFAYKGDK